MGTWTWRAEAAGPGLAVAVKDAIDVAGLPTGLGCQAVTERATPAAADAPLLAGLRAAEADGWAHLAGKTSLHELVYGLTGINRWAGTPVNPLDPTRVPGGSSSGSAVAVASGEADLAYGTDTGGSIRVPAACCGIAGLKTTWGRVPVTGIWPLAPSMDTAGPMAADVAGLITGMQLLLPGFVVGDHPERVRVGRLRIGAADRIERTIDGALAAAGWAVTELGAEDGLDAEYLRRVTTAAYDVLDSEAWAHVRPLFETIAGTDRLRVRGDRDSGKLRAEGPDGPVRLAGIGADAVPRLLATALVTDAEVEAAVGVRGHWRDTLAGVFEQVDLLALPTLLDEPPRLEEANMTPIRGLVAAVNLAGVPALAVPLPAPGGLPASIQLIGPHGSEEALLAAGAALERAVGQ